MPTDENAPVTDSPWFWVLLFSLMGLGALAAISGKYGQRQSRLERQYQARERIAEDALADSDRREYSTSDATLIALWPLAVLLTGVAVFAAVMLVRERRGQTIRGGRCPRPGSLREESSPP